MDSASRSRWPTAAVPWWLRVWASIAVAGALASPLVLGVSPAATLWLVGSALGLVALAILAPARTAIDWSRCSRYAGLCGAAFVAQVALIQVLGPAGLWVALVAAATSPWVTRRGGAVLAKRGLRVTPTPAGPRPQRAPVDPVHLGLLGPIQLFLPVDATPESVAGMETAHLCQAWRRSFLGLEVANASAELQEVVRVRRLLLDELHDRHPGAVRRWLAAGGRAASGPERFLDLAEGRPGD